MKIRKRKANIFTLYLWIGWLLEVIGIKN